MCLSYTNHFSISIVTIINKQATNKQISYFLVIKWIAQKNKNKNLMNVFDITKKYCNLACIDSVKT